MDDERDPIDSTEADDRLARWSADELRRMASDPELSDDMALALLAAGDLPAEAIETLARNAGVMQQRKALTGIVTHPHAPRHVSLPALRKLFTFELMKVAVAPAVAPDLKRAAEDLLIGKLEKIALGERLTLARRASGRVAAALLRDSDVKVVTAALDNRFLTAHAHRRGSRRPSGREAAGRALPASEVARTSGRTACTFAERQSAARAGAGTCARTARPGPR
jgi:hypothetical protein